VVILDMEFFEIIRRKRQREKEKQHTQEVEFVKAKDEISRTIDDNLKYIKELLVDNDCVQGVLLYECKMRNSVCGRSCFKRDYRQRCYKASYD